MYDVGHSLGKKATIPIPYYHHHYHLYMNTTKYNCTRFSPPKWDTRNTDCFRGFIQMSREIYGRYRWYRYIIMSIRYYRWYLWFSNGRSIIQVFDITLCMVWASLVWEDGHFLLHVCKLHASYVFTYKISRPMPNIIAWCVAWPVYFECIIQVYYMCNSMVHVYG